MNLAGMSTSSAYELDWRTTPQALLFIFSPHLSLAFFVTSSSPATAAYNTAARGRRGFCTSIPRLRARDGNVTRMPTGERDVYNALFVSLRVYSWCDWYVGMLGCGLVGCCAPTHVLLKGGREERSGSVAGGEGTGGWCKYSVRTDEISVGLLWLPLLIQRGRVVAQREGRIEGWRSPSGSKAMLLTCRLDLDVSPPKYSGARHISLPMDVI